MEAFKTHRGLLATLDRANVDTDQIIPKQFLKSIQRTGFGENLFYDWRFQPDGKPNPKFSLNQAKFKGASLLVARNNFGCGSSREHAVWAIQQFGVRAVIAPWKDRNGTRAPGFADIFKNNAAKNSLLTIELSEADVEKIFKWVDQFPLLQATVNLEKQRLTIHLADEMTFQFEVDPSVKARLTHGLDEIGLTLAEGDAITQFEKSRTDFLIENNSG